MKLKFHTTPCSTPLASFGIDGVLGLILGKSHTQAEFKAIMQELADKGYKQISHQDPLGGPAIKAPVQVGLSLAQVATQAGPMEIGFMVGLAQSQSPGTDLLIERINLVAHIATQHQTPDAKRGACKALLDLIAQELGAPARQQGSCDAIEDCMTCIWQIQDSSKTNEAHAAQPPSLEAFITEARNALRGMCVAAILEPDDSGVMMVVEFMDFTEPDIKPAREAFGKLLAFTRQK